MCRIGAAQAERAEDAAKRGLTPEEALEANMEAEFAIDDIYGNMWFALQIRLLPELHCTHASGCPELQRASADLCACGEHMQTSAVVVPCPHV